MIGVVEGTSALFVTIISTNYARNEGALTDLIVGALVVDE